MKINTPKPQVPPKIVSGKIELEFSVPDDKPEEGKEDGVEDKPEDEMSKLKKQFAEMQSQLEALKKKDEETLLDIKRLEETTIKSNKVNILLNSDAYNKISKDEGFKMLGYFTEKSQKAGYPWRVLKPGGLFKQGKEISLVEAAGRLGSGDEVIMQPMRVMSLDLSAATLATATSFMSPVAAAATAVGDLSKKTKVSGQPVGREAKFGAPVRLDSFGELKLLSELYDPEAKGVEGEKVSDAAKTLGKFSQTITTNHPWRIMKSEDEGKAWRVVKGALKKGFTWALVGAGVGAIVGGVGGLVAEKIASFALFGLTGAAATAAVTGAAAGAVGTVKGGVKAYKGKEISSFEALSRVVDEKPIILQKQEMRSIKALFYTHNYFKDDGEPNVITGVGELKTFSNILPDK